MSKVKSLSELKNWGGGFPTPHEFSTLDDVLQWQKNDPSLEYAEALEVSDALITRWTDPHVRKPVGLYLHGGPGNGKTHTAVALGREVAERGVFTAYIHLPSLDKMDLDVISKMAGFMDNPSMERFNSNPNNIFSPNITYDSPLKSMPRPKSALILDDYRPEFQTIAHAAVEAAAERSGLIIITSNHKDPFGLLETPEESPKSDSDLALRAIVSRENFGDNSSSEIEDNKRAQAAMKISESLASRMAAMFKIVSFNGPDHRIDESFWNF